MTAQKFQIREATPSDDVAIGELLVEAFVNSYARKMPEVVVTAERKAELRAVADKRKIAKVFVAELSGKVVGTVALWPPRAPGSEAWLEGASDLRHLAVSGSHRGLGISDALLDRAEQMAWELGSPVVCLHVRRGAQGVRELYVKRGYQRDEKGDLDKPSVYLEAYFLPKPR
ncbi:MAG: GNAT family N-acetyltransferase [Myxococcaceae bacterium]